MVQFSVSFLGTTVVDKRFSPPMIPWIIADIRRRRNNQKIRLTIENAEIIGEVDDVVLFRHHVQSLHGFGFEPNNVKTFMYLVKVNYEPVLNVYLFQGSAHEDGLEIFQSIRESTREQATAAKSQDREATLTSLCPDISPTNSQFFEVLYVGKMKVSHHKAPETFIDDALEKFRLYELERAKRRLVSQCVPASLEKETFKTQCQNEMNASGAAKNENVGQETNKKVTEEVGMPGISDRRISCDSQDGGNINEGSVNIGKNKFDGSSEVEVKNDTRPTLVRAGSLGIIETYKKKGDDQGNQNRTMLFYLGQKDLRLISPDRKIVLFHKMLKEINCCVQGIQNSQHFGLISREINSYFAYVFKCESNSVADHIVSAISQTSQSIKESKERPKQSIATCEHCPMMWFHKLCYDIRDQSDKTRQLTILKRIEGLPEHEQTDIHTKFLGAESSDVKEQNEFLMILLRTHCERKQIGHVHDTEETRSEFLNQVLGGSTIFMKAKRSLTNSFDHLLKRKGSQDVLPSKELINDSSNQDKCNRSYLTVGPADGEIMMKEISKHIKNRVNKQKGCKKDRRNFETGVLRKTTSMQDTTEGFWSNTDWRDALDETDASASPLMNIFMKVGSASKMPPQNFGIQEEGNQTPNGSWRQAIYNRVVTPGKGMDEGGERKPRKRNKDELRDLWKTAINQQILLIRMEKENARLKERQEEATVKRIKLEYDDFGSFVKEQMSFWDMITSKETMISSKCDVQSLLHTVAQGIPRAKRGDVWFHFANQYCLNHPPFDSSAFPNYDVPYEDLLKQLTSFQHTILIDLGRTFPNHPYFSSPLGPGQLALFNLLKAYSLLDPQVGYCQGLSFVAGVLLLHLSEDQAFLLLRHLMFRRNLRKQYLSDLAALQVQLYQLSRLLHDSLPQLYVHFDKNEIAPTLYAASWMLTLFASQFPLGFVTRVFDLLFVEETTNIIFRVIMALLEEHSQSLLSLSSFEEIMDYLKNDIPKMDAKFVDRLMKKVLSMDISKQLHEFEVEYHVLQEEISTPRAELDRLKRVDVENKKLKNENIALQEQMEVMTKSLKRLEEFRLTQQGTIKKLENKINALEMTVKVFGEFIVEMRENNREIDIPLGVRRLLASIESIEDEGADKTRPSHVKSAFFRRAKSTGDANDKLGISEFCTVDDLPNGTKFGDQTEGTDMKSGLGGTGLVPHGTLKGISLKVLEDDEKFESRNSTKLSSKFTSGVTSLFGSSSNGNSAVQRQNHRKMSDDVPANENDQSKDILSLHSKESASRLERKENLAGGIRSMAVEKVSCSPTDESAKETTQNGHHLHPLGSSNGVNITFNGTTKLKSLKSGHQLIKNHSIDLIPINKYNKMLHISEDGDP